MLTTLAVKDTAGTLKHFGVLISKGPYKQPRITKNNFGMDMLWGVSISECSYIEGPYIRGSLYIILLSRASSLKGAHPQLLVKLGKATMTTTANRQQ
jgi:hypothetical protein